MNRPITVKEAVASFGILNKMEIIDNIDTWLYAIEKDDLRFSISEMAKIALSHTLQRLRKKVLSTRLPVLADGLSTYDITICNDKIVLSVVSWSEDVEFSMKDRYNREDVASYVPIMSVSVPDEKIEDWAKANEIDVTTAKRWASLSRIETNERGGIFYVSCIQYVPNAPFDSHTHAVIYNSFGFLPATITSEFPFLSGNNLLLMISPNEAEKNWNVLVANKLFDGSTATDSKKITDSARRIIMDYLEKQEISPCTDKLYISPLANIDMSERKRKNLIVPCPPPCQVSGACCGSDNATLATKFMLSSFIRPSIPLCKLEGQISFAQDDAVRRLSTALFPSFKPEYRAFNALKYAGIADCGRSLWNESRIIIDKISINPVAEDETIVRFLKSIPSSTKCCFIFEPALIMFVMDLKDDLGTRIVRLLKAAGYAQVEEGETLGYGSGQSAGSVFYAYNEPLIDAPSFVC